MRFGQSVEMLTSHEDLTASLGKPARIQVPTSLQIIGVNGPHPPRPGTRFGKNIYFVTSDTQSPRTTGPVRIYPNSTPGVFAQLRQPHAIYGLFYITQF